MHQPKKMNLTIMKAKVEVLNLLGTRRGNMLSWPTFSARGLQRSEMSTQKDVAIRFHVRVAEVVVET